MAMMRTVDSKGRLLLGKAYAGRTVIVQRKAGRIIITPAVVIPEQETWLHENEEARQSVRRGLAQAKRREFSASLPDLEEDATFAAELND